MDQGEMNPLDRLTPAQLEVVELVYQGYGNKQIALKLGKAIPTVEKLLYSSYRRLGIIHPHLNQRTELVKLIGNLPSLKICTACMGKGVILTFVKKDV